MPRQYIVEPQIHGDVTVGSEGTDMKVLLGHLAETGPVRRVFFGGSQEFVALILGKRGSGKSHTLGALVEGLATRSDSNSIAEHKRRRAVLLLDPMGNFWTTEHMVRPDGPAKVRKQFDSFEGWGCKPEEVATTIWLPAGFRTPNDPPTVREFRVNVADLEAADIADLVGVNLVRDPQGVALAEAFEAVTSTGWTNKQQKVAPRRDFSFTDLVSFLECLRNEQASGDHQESTLRALIRSLRGLERLPSFSAPGTPLTDLLIPGTVGILMLPLRVGTDLRRVITRLLIRRILREREEASQIRQRLDVESLDAPERLRLESELTARIPKTILALDEAQELLGDDGHEAREALENFCLLGRNYGLSLLLATQRPTASAISPRVRSQVDLYFLHRLLTQEDIEIAEKNLLAISPQEVMAADRELDFPQLLRSLERGQALVVPSWARASDAVSRYFVASIRPRVTVHGGEVE